MQYEEFIDRIRRRARLDMAEETQTASRVTPTALWGECLARCEALDFAAQLPQGIAEVLLRQFPGEFDPLV
ncbi:MAG TPA: DUF2267 domain-containing protein, partial [Rubrobacteraceae bacterium]|nr:DUF2267 domain-containing protein [Rubrobacteraceae bacterium]